MAQRALDARAGKAGVVGVALALDGVVDHAHGLPGAHVDGADGVEEDGGGFSNMVGSFVRSSVQPGLQRGKAEAVEALGAALGIFAGLVHPQALRGKLAERSGVASRSSSQ
jgi:hypothetical protein